ncbi:hypothetical protein EDC17_101191 [Sphingobacterium alimentarium]|uniref:Uncharacterized protein n=1 Tax=Sphingobacterium alimentarium TaxID=797292 RepID=A0A4R3VUI0_9SPHI|nr:hypothetical protein [Sphingobacterium alimentarium]TCV17172.1 hypothetical protein EDC17_101191 [Sphingobacterium alimentarium]
MKKNGIESALEYGKSLTKELSPKIHYLTGYNQAVEDYNSIEADAIQDFLSTEIMVLREKNTELVEMLRKVLLFKKYQRVEDYVSIDEIEVLINSNITE